MHFPRHITSKNPIAFCGLKSGLRPFQALEIFSMLKIKVDMQGEGILADKMEYKKIRYLIFKKYIADLIKRFNV